ncbi:helix-turn-helix domain-containing protein [Paenibacillus sp. HW567]|uniref:helix-turn-helix domain-containing protein n=1 Tax=Paenibacillus sp. HW567 TaxID=1034769 RepID=UPI00037B2CB7|nr:helix-turn-helix domain-containing protein [Paenibacillus sp. HW567]
MDFKEILDLIQHKNKRVSQRATCILLHLKDALSTAEISSIMGISQRTVQRYIKNYHKAGINSITEETRGRKKIVAHSIIQDLLKESPLKHGFLLDTWYPHMLQIETKASYSTCRRILEQSAFTRKETAASINSRDLQNYLEDADEITSEIWLIHVFKLGNDEGKVEFKTVRYTKDFYCFIAINIGCSSNDRVDPSLSHLPLHISSVKSFSRSLRIRGKFQDEFRKKYHLFIQNTIDYIHDNVEAPIHLLMYTTPSNQSALFHFQRDQKQTSIQKSDVKAYLLKNRPTTGFYAIQSFEKRMKIAFSKIRRTDTESIKKHKEMIDKNINKTIPKITTHFWKS